MKFGHGIYFVYLAKRNMGDAPPRVADQSELEKVNDNISVMVSGGK